MHIPCISFSRETYVFVDGSLNHLTLIVKKRLNNLSVGRIFTQNSGTSVTIAERCFIINISDRPKNKNYVSVNIQQSHLSY